MNDTALTLLLESLALTLLVALTRAREGRADMSELGQQTDPHQPPGRRCGCWPLSPTVADFVLADSGSGRTMELGRSGRTMMMRPPRRWRRWTAISYGVGCASTPPRSTPH